MTSANVIYARRSSLWFHTYGLESDGRPRGSFSLRNWKRPTRVELDGRVFEILDKWQTLDWIGWRAQRRISVIEGNTESIEIVRSSTLTAEYADLEFDFEGVVISTPAVGTMGRAFKSHPVFRDKQPAGQIEWAGPAKRDWEINLVPELSAPVVALMFYWAVCTT